MYGFVDGGRRYTYVNKAITIVNYNFINSDSRVPKYSTTTNDPINAGMLF